MRFSLSVAADTAFFLKSRKIDPASMLSGHRRDGLYGLVAPFPQAAAVAVVADAECDSPSRKGKGDSCLLLEEVNSRRLAGKRFGLPVQVSESGHRSPARVAKGKGICNPCILYSFSDFGSGSFGPAVQHFPKRIRIEKGTSKLS
jgi:hypothetical protein